MHLKFKGLFYMQIGDDRDGQPVVQVEHACNGLE